MKSPKEKAAELVRGYMKYTGGFNIEYAKQCALIAVDEIINANPENYIAHDEPKEFLSFPDYTHVDAKKYWHQVKTEIENL